MYKRQILYHDASWGFVGFLGCQTYAVIVIHLLDVYGSAFLGNVLQTCLGGTLRHMYHCLLSKTVGGPCNAASVVAVCGGEEGSLAKFFS